MRRLLYMTLVTVIAMTAASAGVLLWRKFNPPPVAVTGIGPPAAPGLAPAADTAPALAVGDRRPEVTLRDLDGRPRSISEWDGQLLFVNFWATWCPPCVEEIPGFVRLQAAHREAGVVFLGVALDSPDNVRAFVERHGVNYLTLHGEKDAIDASKAFGNAYGALPFTAVVGRDGRILTLHSGIMDEREAERLIEAHS